MGIPPHPLHRFLGDDDDDDDDDDAGDDDDGDDDYDEGDDDDDGDDIYITVECIYLCHKSHFIFK